MSCLLLLARGHTSTIIRRKLKIFLGAEYLERKRNIDVMTEPDSWEVAQGVWRGEERRGEVTCEDVRVWGLHIKMIFLPAAALRCEGRCKAGSSLSFRSGEEKRAVRPHWLMLLWLRHCQTPRLTAQDCSTTCRMSLNLNDAAMAGNVEEVLIRLNLGEDVNQKCYPR